MLVLTRKIDESIIIGDNIKIIVVDIRGDQGKIGTVRRSIRRFRQKTLRQPCPAGQ